MGDRFEMVPITVAHKGRWDFIYVVTYVLNWEWLHSDKRVLNVDYLSKKFSIASKVGIKTITLTTYFKKNCNYDLSLEPREHYVFHTIEDAKKAISYLNDCMVAKKLVEGGC